MQEKLILIRKKTGTSQEKLAKLLGINPKTYSCKELGKNEFSMNEMFEIAKYFNMHIEDIFLPSLLQNGVKNEGEEQCQTN